MPVFIYFLFTFLFGKLIFFRLAFEVGAFQENFKTASESKAPSEIACPLSRYFLARSFKKSVLYIMNVIHTYYIHHIAIVMYSKVSMIMENPYISFHTIF